jgi:two-component system sensor kinase FixL
MKVSKSLLLNDTGPFAVAVSHTRMPMIFVDARSATNEIVYANHMYLEMMCSRSSNTLGKPFPNILAADENLSLGSLHDLNTQNQTTDVAAKFVRDNGASFEASLRIVPICASSGEIENYFICFIDLSRSDLYQRIVQSRVNALYRHAPGFFAITEGPSHTFTFANDAYYKLVGHRQLIGLSVSKALPELADQGVMPLLDGVYAGARHVQRDRMPMLLNRGQGGTTELRYVTFVYEPVLHVNGTVIGIFCEGYDVTDVEETANELRLLQSRLIQMSRLNAMGTMAATLAHEINQPLAAISNFASGCINLLAITDENSRAVSEGLAAIGSAASRAGDIIRRLRYMTRKTNGKSEVFNLADVVADSLQLVKAGAFENVRIDTNFADVGIVRADRVQIQQVIINLLKNACEAAGDSEQGVVSAAIFRKDGKMQLRIGDNGPGVSPITLKTLFEWVESTKPFGMGIGLSICRTIVESQGGSIWLEKTSDEGACFAMALPDIAI